MKTYYLAPLLFTLYGCGQMGPLYLPGTPPPIHVKKEKAEPPASETPETQTTQPPTQQ